MLLSVLLLLTSAGADVAASGAPAPARPVFAGRIEPLSEEVQAEMRGVSWSEGCPVPLEDLRLLTLTYLGYDERSHEGELVVHAAVADEMVAVFRDLYAAGFPVERLERIERYAGSDDASMAANNTSAFNCRPVAGRSGGFSRHSYGLAVDINPRVNPFVRGEKVSPPEGKRYLKRDEHLAPGMIRRDDAVVRAFRARGFQWGGGWRSLKDYQHFDKSPKATLARWHTAKAKRPPAP